MAEQEEEQRSSPWTESLCKANLFASTLVQVVLTRLIFKPSFLGFLIGLPASELVHYIAFVQAVNLYAINYISPQIFSSSGHYFSKLFLAINFLCFSRQLQAVKDLLGAKQDFAVALQNGGIASHPTKWIYFLASFLPLPYLASRGKTLKRQTFRYADIRKIDPELSQLWNDTPPNLRRMLYVRAGRDTIPNWLSLDVTVRADNDMGVKRPVLFYIHGGGWTVGSKLFALNAALQRIASRGVVVVSINYRLSPEVTFPTHVQDCKRALVFVKQQCHLWGGDASQVFCCGESAGGHLAALIGCTPNLPEFQPFDLQADTSVRGCIPLYGVMDLCDNEGHHAALHPPLVRNLDAANISLQGFLERAVFQIPLNEETKHEFQMASPPYHVQNRQARQGDLPPFMVVHGTRDSVAAYGDSRAFFEILCDYRQRVQSRTRDLFVPVRGGHHAFGYLPSPRAVALGDAICDFISHHHTTDLLLQQMGTDRIVD